MNIKQKIAEWLGYGYGKPPDFVSSPLCIVSAETLAEIKKNPAFVETHQYPRWSQIICGEVGMFNNKRIILDTMLSLTIRYEYI